MATKAARCKHCNLPITWVMNERNGHRIPVDIDPSPTGNITRTGHVDWDGTPIVRVYANEQLALNADLTAHRWVNHRQTCQGKR